MSIRNIQPEPAAPTWLPGTVIVLPDGAVTLIEEELPTGELRASNGMVITQEGRIKETDEKIKIFRQTDLRIGAPVKLSDGKEDVLREKLPDGRFRTKRGLLVTQDGKVLPQIKNVETFEEAEKFLPKTDKPQQNEEKAVKPDVDPIAELLTFKEPAQPKIEKPKKQRKFVAKKGDKLTIPPGAAAGKDFSFLKGCWRSDSITYYSSLSTFQAPAELCFKGNGGHFLSYYGGSVCSARTKARFSSGVLLIQAGRGPCQGNENATIPRVFQCEGQGSRTECYILATNGWGGIFKSRARFYKK